MPIRRNYNCGCGFNTPEEPKAITHVKETGHQVEGRVSILTKSQVQRRECRPDGGMIINGKYRPIYT